MADGVDEPPDHYAVFRYTGSDGTSAIVGSSSGLVPRMMSPQNNPIRPIDPATSKPVGISTHVRGSLNTVETGWVDVSALTKLSKRAATSSLWIDATMRRANCVWASSLAWLS